jgi:hypothetical protein
MVQRSERRQRERSDDDEVEDVMEPPTEKASGAKRAPRKRAEQDQDDAQADQQQLHAAGDMNSGDDQRGTEDVLDGLVGEEPDPLAPRAR